MERINKILLAENPIREPEHPTHIEALRDNITFNDVRFAYKNANSESENTEVIRGVSFTVRRGQTIALVGQSGSGKSTLVDLVPRFHDVTGGSISIDGHDVRTLRLSELRALIGNVNQEAILFNDTFFNNISFGVEMPPSNRCRKQRKWRMPTTSSWQRRTVTTLLWAIAAVASPADSDNAYLSQEPS